MTRRLPLFSVSLAVLLATGAAAVPPEGGKPNVLFIAIDDLNDWVGYLGGHPDTITPHIDRLAARGAAFTNAYCVSPICGPSRASVLTGLRPETSGVYHNKGTYSDYVPEALALPRFLRDGGYHVMGCGKLNHAMGCIHPENYDEFGPDAGAIGGPFTWEELNMTPGKPVERTDIAGQRIMEVSGVVVNEYPGKVIERGELKATLPLNGIDNTTDRPLNGYNTFDWGPVSIDDDAMPDGQMASWAEEKLTDDYGDKPFFLGVGFYRPHQPWYAPAKYFEHFLDRDITHPTAPADDLEDCPATARHYAHYPWSGSFATVQQHDQWSDALRGYLASIHFADAQVGRLIDALDASPHADNTLIVLWSDHGWELGEKEHWGKHSPWEGSTRVPLIIVPPGGSAAPANEDGFASLLDLYPTIADYCGLEAPTDLEGLSLRPIIEGATDSVRDHVVTTLGRSSHAIRKGDWKYIHYYDGSEELYDLAEDPDELTNLTQDPQHAPALAELRPLVPDDPHFTRFVRLGHRKAVITADDQLLLFDMLEQPNGIGEHDDRAAEHPDLVAEIREKISAAEFSNQRFIALP